MCLEAENFIDFSENFENIEHLQSLEICITNYNEFLPNINESSE